eukprot:Sspe_Gene.3698::Locus_1229_Transcript_1_1_Confidence_1.000_Length_6310::g.3698::m.3698
MKVNFKYQGVNLTESTGVVEKPAAEVLSHLRVSCTGSKEAATLFGDEYSNLELNVEKSPFCPDGKGEKCPFRAVVVHNSTGKLQLYVDDRTGAVGLSDQRRSYFSVCTKYTKVW